MYTITTCIMYKKGVVLHLHRSTPENPPPRNLTAANHPLRAPVRFSCQPASARTGLESRGAALPEPDLELLVFQYSVSGE